MSFIRTSMGLRVGSLHPLSHLNTKNCARRSQIASSIQRLGICRALATQHGDLRVKQDRLWNDIHSTSNIGANNRWGAQETETGVTRLALSDLDRDVRDWFTQTVKELGCTLSVDEMGNMIAIRPGKRDGPPTAAGSHLDTQPTGGRYDGILGVCAAVEMLRVLKERNIETEYPVAAINWTNEEGARFPISMVSSGVWAGRIPLKKAHDLKVVGGGGQTMKGELGRIGYLGSLPASFEGWPIASHFELHIEQGQSLERTKRRIGIVTGVQAYRWYTINVTGRDCHTGTTDFPSRADALLAAARMIVASNEIAQQHGGLASTGIIHAHPGSVNTVPGSVSFSLDLRSPKDEILSQMETEVKSRFEAIASGGGKTGPVEVEWALDAPSVAIRFHDDCINCIEQATHDALGSEAGNLSMRLMSGAGHDSVYTSFRAPTGMIFVPCRNGVSHNPEEYCSPEDCALGAQVLLNAVLRYDELRAARDSD